MKFLDSILGRPPQQTRASTQTPTKPGVILITLAYQVDIDQVVFDAKMREALATLNAAVARQVGRKR